MEITDISYDRVETFFMVAIALCAFFVVIMFWKEFEERRKKERARLWN